MIDKLPKELIETATNVLSGRQEELNRFCFTPSKPYPSMPIDFLWDRTNIINEGVVDTTLDFIKSLKGTNFSNLPRSDDSHLSHHGDTLTEDERKHALAYVVGGLYSGHSSGSFPINNHLQQADKNRENPGVSYKFPGGYEFKFHTFDTAIHKNALSKETTLYTGVSFDPRKYMDERNTIHNHGYTSTSLDPVSALLYSRKTDNNEKHIIKITAPEGTTGLYLGKDPRLTNKPIDTEYVLPRGSKIKLSKFPRVVEHIGGVKTMLWDAKLI